MHRTACLITLGLAMTGCGGAGEIFSAEEGDGMLEGGIPSSVDILGGRAATSRKRDRDRDSGSDDNDDAPCKSRRKTDDDPVSRDDTVSEKEREEKVEEGRLDWTQQVAPDCTSAPEPITPNYLSQGLLLGWLSLYPKQGDCTADQRNAIREQWVACKANAIEVKSASDYPATLGILSHGALPELHHLRFDEASQRRYTPLQTILNVIDAQPQLVGLRWDSFRLNDHAVKSVLVNPRPNLQDVTFNDRSWVGLTDVGVQALLNSQHLPDLRVLRLSGSFTEKSVEVLRTSRHAGTLQQLELHSRHLNGRVFAQIGADPALSKAVTHLSLGNLDGFAVSAGKFFSSLRTIRFFGTEPNLDQRAQLWGMLPTLVALHDRTKVERRAEWESGLHPVPKKQICALFQNIEFLSPLSSEDDCRKRFCEDFGQVWAKLGYNALTFRLESAGQRTTFRSFFQQKRLPALELLEVDDVLPAGNAVSSNEEGAVVSNDEMEQVVLASEKLNAFAWTSFQVDDTTVDWLLRTPRAWTAIALYGNISDAGIRKLLKPNALPSLRGLRFGNFHYSGGPLTGGTVSHLSLKALVVSPHAETLTSLAIYSRDLKFEDLMTLANHPSLRANLKTLHIGFNNKSDFTLDALAQFRALETLSVHSHELTLHQRALLWRALPMLQHLNDHRVSRTRDDATRGLP